MSVRRILLALDRNPKAIAAASLVVASALGSAAAVRAEGSSSWCAPELEALSESVCYYSPTAGAPAADGGNTEGAHDDGAHDDGAHDDGAHDDGAQQPRRPRTLVFFLHPLVGVGSHWQWEQQRLFARLGKTYHLSVLMPRAPAERNSGSNALMHTWPNSAKAQAREEADVLAEWMQVKRVVEEREGRFERTLIFGFSNGAYYATSLVLRSRIAADGFGIFAGGEALNFLRPSAAKAERRPPVFVGYGTQDPMHHDQEALIELLRSLGWPYRAKAANVGHMVTEEQLRDALRFLGAVDPRD